MAQELEKNNLADFDWENEDTFFEIPTPGVDSKKTVPKVEGTEPTPDPKSKAPEEEEDDDPFETFGKPEPEGEEEEDKGTPTATGEGNVYVDLYKDMKSTGMFKHVEIEEGEEIDADRFAELQELEYDAEVTARLVHWASNELDPDAQAFIKFKKDGGSTEQFFQAYQKSTDLPQGNIENEDYQDQVIRYQLREEGWDKDEIEDRLEYLTTSGRKKSVAQKYDVKVKAEDEKRKQAVLKQAEETRKAIKAQEDEFKADIQDTLISVEEVGGFRLSPKDKSDILNFLTKKDQKVSDTKSVTSFQKKLAEVFQDAEKTILLAKLLSSDFDFSSLEKKAQTKKTKEIKTNLEQRKSLRPSVSGSSSQGSSLADLFK